MPHNLTDLSASNIGLIRNVENMYLQQRASLLTLIFGTISVSILYLPIILMGKSTVFAGERYYYLGDDAMISMRYARNFVMGAGLVWNPGERVEGYTNLLWTLYMAAVHLLPVPISKTSLIVLLTNLLLAVATIPALVRLVRILGGNVLAIGTSVAAFVLNGDVAFWATAGFETTLLGFALALVVGRIFLEAKYNHPRITTYFLLGTITLIRSDAFVLTILLIILALALTAERSRILCYSLLSPVFPLAHTAIRLVYYGDLLPNTAYLKTTGWPARSLSGIAYVMSFALRYGPVILTAFLGSILTRRRTQIMLLSVLVLHAATVAYLGGDAFTNYRFFVPVLPLWLVLGFLAVEKLPLRLLTRGLLALACMLVLPVVVNGYSSRLRPDMADTGNLAIALWLRANTPPTTRVADFWAGSVFYFSERPGIDLLGKTDRYVARLPVSSDGTKPGHNKFNFDYSLGQLRPDIVVANFPPDVKREYLEQYLSGDWAFTGQLYYHLIFQKHCFPHQISANTWRAMFVCDWSPLITQITLWKKSE